MFELLNTRINENEALFLHFGKLAPLKQQSEKEVNQIQSGRKFTCKFPCYLLLEAMTQKWGISIWDTYAGRYIFFVWPIYKDVNNLTK